MTRSNRPLPTASAGEAWTAPVGVELPLEIDSPLVSDYAYAGPVGQRGRQALEWAPRAPDADRDVRVFTIDWHEPTAAPPLGAEFTLVVDDRHLTRLDRHRRCVMPRVLHVSSEPILGGARLRSTCHALRGPGGDMVRCFTGRVEPEESGRRR